MDHGLTPHDQEEAGGEEEVDGEINAETLDQEPPGGMGNIADPGGVNVDMSAPEAEENKGRRGQGSEDA